MAVEKSPNKHEPTPFAIDRISDLPHSLLLHILSFLPAEDAVKTSLLSTRWRYIWTSICTLDFDAARFHHNIKKASFMGFVDKILMLRDGSDLYKLTLSYSESDCDTCRAHTWISSAIHRNVKELDLKICGKGVFEFPHCVFISESLATLKLNLGLRFLKVPMGIGFSSLKTLHLLWVILGDKNPNLELFSKCPLLQYLNIEYCRIDNLNIFALKLKSLIIKDCDPEIKIKVSAPSLVSFKYIGSAPDECILENLSSLADAVLDIRGIFRIRTFRCLSKILQGVSNAEVLALSMDCIMFPYRHRVSGWPPTPHYNLKRLKLITVCAGDFHCIKGIARFLECCINVETFTITLTPLHRCTSIPFKTFPLQCPLHHLKDVEIRQFEGGEYQLELVRFLLMNAKVMEKMIIYTSGEEWTALKKRTEINKKLLTFPKASSSITIIFS